MLLQPRREGRSENVRTALVGNLLDTYFPTMQQRRPSFERMEATLLACPKCKRAVPVRKRLLLVLPQGDKYLYICPDCGSTCGETIETPTPLQSR